MNNKVSNIQIGMLSILMICSMYLGISDIILLRKSMNEVLISMLLGTIIGLIPVFMYLKINNYMPKLNIFEKNNKLFGKIFGNIINIFFIIMYILFLIIIIRAISIFVTSKYMQNTEFFLVGLLCTIAGLIICFKGLEPIARISQITFLASIFLMFIIELLLIKYVKIDNIFPINLLNTNNIIDGALYFSSTTWIFITLLLCINKDKINNNVKYNKTILLSYLLGCFALILIMFFAISCFGYNMATLFRYPEYVLLKKITISSSELHLENLLAFRWIFYMFSLLNISLYGIITGVKHYIKNKKINILIVLLISFISILLAKYGFGNIPHSINIIKNYFSIYIALPMFIIITIIFIKVIIKRS